MRKPNPDGARVPGSAPKASPDPARRRRMLHLLILFVAAVLIVDGLAGERGFLETMRARKQYNELAASITRLRNENARLREEARRLREDPRTIEGIARQELGLIRPGEVLFIVKDVPSPSMPE